MPHALNPIIWIQASFTVTSASKKQTIGTRSTAVSTAILLVTQAVPNLSQAPFLTSSIQALVCKFHSKDTEIQGKSPLQGMEIMSNDKKFHEGNHVRGRISHKETETATNE